MTSEHLEIEQKFDVADSFKVPDLTAVPGVAQVEGPQEHHLLAVYYDTADLSLLRAKVTLRRRTGGLDEGWHVKIPAGFGARREMQLGLGPAGEPVPARVLDLVQHLSHGAELSPVAVLRTTRRVRSLWSDTDEQLAEVADDTVSATAYAGRPGGAASVTTWREVEVELYGGDEKFLVEVGRKLLDAGATASGSASKLGRVLEDRLAEQDGTPPAAVDVAPDEPTAETEEAPKTEAAKVAKIEKDGKAKSGKAGKGQKAKTGKAKRK